MKYTDYREAKKHGREGFSLQYYYIDPSHPQYHMPLHWHSEFEIIRVLQGNLTLWVNAERYELSEGGIAYVEGGSLHRGEAKNCRYECAVFDPRMVAGQGGARLLELVTPLCTGGAETARMCPHADGAANSLFAAINEGGEFFELMAASAVSRLIYELYKCGAVKPVRSGNKRSNQRRAIIARLLEEIETNYTEKISNARLADIAGVNEKYICRFFKEYTGYTPADYVIRLRVEKACHEMRFNHKNVTEAAYECGFNEMAYFSKCFKKYKGVTPSRYAKNTDGAY